MLSVLAEGDQGIIESVGDTLTTDNVGDKSISGEGHVMATRNLPCEKFRDVWELPGWKEPVVAEGGETVEESDVKGELTAAEE